MSKTINRILGGATTAFIASDVFWDLPENATHQISVPIENYTDEVNFECPNAEGITLAINKITYNGVILDVFVPNGATPGSYDLIVHTPGGKTNENLLGVLANNHQARLNVVTTGNDFRVYGNDSIEHVSDYTNPFNGYLDDSWHNFANADGPRSAQVLTLNDLNGIVVKIDRPTRVTEARVRVTVGAVGAAVFGLFKLDEVNNKWRKVVQTDPASPLDTSLVATTTIALENAVILEPGIYCSSAHSSATITMYALSFECAHPYLGVNPTMSTTDYKSGLSLTTAYSATMPETPALVPSPLSWLPHIIYHHQKV